MTDNVLILGAGAYQVPLIRAVQARGLRAVVASIPGPWPGFSIADEEAHIDTRDAGRLLELARDRHVAAVLTAGTDVAVASVGRLCDELGLRGVSAETAYRATNKIAMKRAFAAGGVNGSRFHVADAGCGLAECMRIVEEEVGYPAIFKAVDLSGSRGITKVHSRADVERAYANVHAASRQPQFLIEQCLMGREFGIEAFVREGNVELFVPNGKYLFDGTGTAVPFGHFAPYGTDATAAKALEQVRKLVAALGVQSGPVNVDAIWIPNSTGNGSAADAVNASDVLGISNAPNDTATTRDLDGEVYIIEAGARTGATGLPEIVGLRHGFDYHDAIVAAALGESVRIPPACKGVCAVSMLMGADRSGEVASVKAPEKPSSAITYRDVGVRQGDRVTSFDIGPDRIGLVVAGAASIEEAEHAVWAEIDQIDCRLSDGTRINWLRGRKD